MPTARTACVTSVPTSTMYSRSDMVSSGAQTPATHTLITRREERRNSGSSLRISRSQSRRIRSHIVMS